jgi:hypothetical protein
MMWKTTQDFADWYVKNKFPFNPPSQVETFLSDDATAFCMFREGQFQVELYLIHPAPLVQVHEHPGVELIETPWINGSCSMIPVLKEGDSHGHGIRETGNVLGYPLIAIQHWRSDLKPTTAAAQWKGKTAGPIHEKLIRRFHPEAYVIQGYADVTRRMSDVANG